MPSSLLMVEAATERVRTQQTHEDADRLFHLRVAAATQNSALVWVVQGLWDQGRGKLWQKVKERMRPVDVRKQWIIHHRTIFDAIASHDPDAAWRAMELHLATVQRELEAIYEVGD